MLLTNIDKLQYLDVNSSLASTQYNTNSLGYNEFNNTLYLLNSTKFNITEDLEIGNINSSGKITSDYTIPLKDNTTTASTTKWVQSEGFLHLASAEIITGVKTFSTNPIITNQYLNGVATIRTGSFTTTAPYQEYYPIAPTATQTITLPVASASLLGVRIRLRRVGGTIGVAINSASVNIYPNTSFTAVNVLLAANVLNVVVTCLYLTSTTVLTVGLLLSTPTRKKIICLFSH